MVQEATERVLRWVPNDNGSPITQRVTVTPTVHPTVYRGDKLIIDTFSLTVHIVLQSVGMTATPDLLGSVISFEEVPRGSTVLG